MNPLHPRHMTPTERRAELCRILAAGLIRLLSRQSSPVSGTDGECSLHFAPDQSARLRTHNQ